MRGRKFRAIHFFSVCMAFLCLLIIFLPGCKPKTREHTSRLKKISAFEVDDKLLHKFVSGQPSICREQPEPEVKIYPAFESDKPLFGSIRFAEVYGEENSGIQYHFAVDESQGRGKGYDRLYFDLNRDLDLTNDKPYVPLNRPPQGANLKNPYLKQEICFHYLSVELENDSGGKHPLEIMPRLMIYTSGSVNLSFVTTEARKGRMRIAGQRYDVFLGHNYVISGLFHHPWTALHLIPNGDLNKQLNWLNSDRLMAIHQIEETYFSFSATPAGDKLTAKPYDGKLGTFIGSSGNRDLTYIGCSGSLFSKDKAVAVGRVKENEPLQLPSKSQIPVGDYLPGSLTIQYDRLRIHLSDNYHSDGIPRGRITSNKNYGIKIREDKPFVFDFSNEPEVLFASPAKDYHLKPGEELTVKAVLIDPKLDVMIRHLIDTSRRKQQDPNGDGLKQTIWKDVSLDPKVVITRANGEQVAEGVMPFG